MGLLCPDEGVGTAAADQRIGTIPALKLVGQGIAPDVVGLVGADYVLDAEGVLLVSEAVVSDLARLDPQVDADAGLGAVIGKEDAEIDLVGPGPPVVPVDAFATPEPVILGGPFQDVGTPRPSTRSMSMSVSV
jgi:hypothetical protein